MQEDWDVPPEKNTPSALTESVLMMALCPLKLNTNEPSGHFHFLMLLPPADPEAKEYSVGWMASARTDFLWWVSVTIVLPAARSHNLHQFVSSLKRARRRRGAPHCRVHTACYDLGVRLLAFHVCYCCRVPREDVDLSFSPHVPYPS